MKLFNYQVIQLFLYKMDDEWQKYLVTYKYLVVLYLVVMKCTSFYYCFVFLQKVTHVNRKNHLITQHKNTPFLTCN